MAKEKQRIVIEDESFVAIMRFARIFGLAPVRIINTRGKTIMYTSRLFVIYGIFIAILYNYLMVRNFFCKNFRGHRILPSKEHFILMAVQYVIKILLISYGLLFGQKRSMRLMYCINEIQTIRKSINNGHKIKTRKWLFFSIIINFIFGLCIIAACELYFFSMWDDIHYYFLYSLFYIEIVIEMQFFVTALSIKSAFNFVSTKLNELLNKISENSEFDDIWDTKMFRTTNTLKIPVKSINIAIDIVGFTEQNYPDPKILQRILLARELRRITHAFVSTCNVLRDLNKGESVPLFLLLSSFCISLVVTISNILNSLHANEYVSVCIMVSQCFWFVYHVSKILLLVEPCCRTQGEVIKIRFLLSHIICYVTPDSDPLQNAIDDFFKQLMLNVISYSVTGISSIGRPLILTIIGSVTTILVMVYK